MTLDNNSFEPLVDARASARSVRRRSRVRLLSTDLWHSSLPPWEKLTTPEDAARFMTRFVGSRDREYFISLHLSTQGVVFGVEIVSVGELNTALVHPREVFKAAILSNADAIIVGHNHPSGDVTPSPEDRAVHRTLKASGDLLGIRVVDFLVVARGKWHSTAAGA
jgi:DNA repair protein RadC